MTNFVDKIEFATEICCACGVPFAMTADFQKRRRSDRQLFYCPAGHGQHYRGPSEESKLRTELEQKKTMLEAAQARAETIKQQKDEIERAHNRMRVRVMNGVCPCCNRTFENLLRHMRTEHAGEITLRNLRSAFGMTQQALAKEARVLSAYVSLYENDKPVPSYAKQAIMEWMQKQNKAMP